MIVRSSSAFRAWFGRQELPGIDPERDVHISTRDHELVIEGERRHEAKVEEDAYYRMEASYGAFERRIPIPDGVDDDEIAATYVDGLLEVVLPAAEAALERHRQIPVTTPKAVKAA